MNTETAVEVPDSFDGFISGEKRRWVFDKSENLYWEHIWQEGMWRRYKPYRPDAIVTIWLSVKDVQS